MKVVQMIAKNEWVHRLGVAVAIAVGLCGVGSSAEDKAEKPAAVDAERYAEFIDNEVFDVQDLAEGAEIQRRMFNRMTPPGVFLFQPMIPPVAPFDADNFDDAFLDELLGEDKYSVAIYPLSLALDPKTRETLVYNAEGMVIATIPADKAARHWPEGAAPSRVTLQLDLLASEDVEPYLYVERRISEYAEERAAKSGKAAKRNLGPAQFGIAGVRRLTNGVVRVTVTNGTDAAEIYSYTVAHTSSAVVATWTNDQQVVVSSTNVLWHPVSPPFRGIHSAWVRRTTYLALTNGVGTWDDANVSSNDRVRFYAAAKRGDADGDGLTDGAEILLHRTDPHSLDTDGDGLLDGYDIQVAIGDARYYAWSNQIVFVGSQGIRLFRGELSAGSDPLSEDTDGDGLPDGWEVQNELDPLDDSEDNGPEGDPDMDGFDNALEYELGGPAQNEAWNGNQLAYRLLHKNTVVVTNTRSITTNLIGLRANIQDSLNCGGTNNQRQNVPDPLIVRSLDACGYYIDITVKGAVERKSNYYDQVHIEAYTNTYYFEGNLENIDCLMATKEVKKNVFIVPDSTVILRYDTMSYKHHVGAFAEIVEATNVVPYRVDILGKAEICVGETTSMGATGGLLPYRWVGGGCISVTNNGEVTGESPGFAYVSVTESNGCSGKMDIVVLQADSGTPSPLANRTLHPAAARVPLLLKKTLPTAWNGQMQLSLYGAVAYWTPTGGMPMASAVFTNADLPRTVYLEGDGCGLGTASFAIAVPPSCGTNVPLRVFGVNATLAGVAEANEEVPGGYILDRTVHTNAPRTALNLAACGPYGSAGNVVLTWNSSQVRIFTAPTGGTALAQFSRPFSGFNGTNLYVEGIAPGSNTLSWSYSGQTDCVDRINVAILKVDFIRQDNSEFPETGNGACHMVSKFTTSANFPDTATFDGPLVVNTGAGYGQGEADPDTFRIQMKGVPSGQSPKIRLQVTGGTSYSHEFTMVNGTVGGISTYRTDEHIRLVSNDVDDGHLAHQTPLVKLGDTVTATLVLDGVDVCSKALCVGRPSSESGVNAIRAATAYFVVVDYSDVAASADTAKTTERMSEAWCQAAAKFASSSRTKTPVRNVIRVSGTATGSGTFGVKVDGVTVPAFGIAGSGRTSPLQIAEDIASGINAVIGAGTAQAFNSAPGFGTPLAHVVVKKGSSVTFADLAETVPVTAITIPTFSVTDDDVEFQDEEPCLAANYGDANPSETVDFFVVKTLATGNRGDAWTPNYCGSASDMRNTSFIVLTAGDAAADNPHTAAHEAGRFFMNYDGLDSGNYNLMNGTSTTDSITARKRLTPTQHQTSRTVSDGTLLKP